MRVERADVLVGPGCGEGERDRVPGFDLPVVLTLDLDAVREVVLVPPGDLVPGVDLDRLRLEAVALRHQDLGRRHRLRSLGAAAAGEHGPDKHEEERDPHAWLAFSDGRRVRATSSTAPRKTRPNAVRSSTSLIVCAKRKTVQSRW